jgi:hypothetical protein
MTATRATATDIDAPRPDHRNWIELRGRRVTFVQLWAASTLVLLAMSVCWMLATPISAGPDEPVHMVKAAATVRGQLLGRARPDTPTAMRTFRVPAVYSQNVVNGACYQFLPDQRASCQKAWSGNPAPTDTYSYVARYPPWYYAVVGLPTLFTSSIWGAFAMRVISSIFCAVLIGLALALSAVFARSRLMVVAVVVSMTPYLLFLASVVNPSGMEMAAGLALWVAGLVIVLDHPEVPPKAAVGALVGAGSVLALSRGISPLWVAITLGTMFLLAPSTFIGWLRRPCAMRRALIALTGVCVFALIVDLAMKSYSVYPAGLPLPPHASSWTILRLSFDRTDMYYHEFVGTLGWLDTRVPAVTMVIWSIMLIGTVVVGLISGSWRQRFCMVLIGVAVLAIPTGITASHARVDGLVWQARYSYPLDVGLLVLAAAVATRGPFARRRVVGTLGTLVAVGFFVGMIASYYRNLHRYVVGMRYPFNLVSGGPGYWKPPLPPLVLMIAASVVITVMTVAFVLVSWTPVTAAGERVAIAGDGDADGSGGRAGAQMTGSSPEPA